MLDIFIFAFNAIIPIILLIALGYILKCKNFLSDDEELSPYVKYKLNELNDSNIPLILATKKSAASFDYIFKDELAGESSYEKGEIQYLKTSLAMLFKKINNYDPRNIFYFSYKSIYNSNLTFTI